jgi:hypothetical protein
VVDPGSVGAATGVAGAIATGARPSMIVTAVEFLVPNWIRSPRTGEAVGWA